MKVSRDSQGDAAIYSVEGQVDMHTSPELRSALKQGLLDKSSPIVVDLGGVTFIDSSGLATLIEALQAVGRYGGKLRLCGLSPEVRKLFDLARLNEVFDLRDDREQALR